LRYGHKLSIANEAFLDTWGQRLAPHEVALSGALV
jgi:hypothetical protein